MRFSPAVYGMFPLVSLLLAPGCALLIPDNPSTPRYNTVMGERHMPELNPRGAMGPQSRASTPEMTPPAPRQAAIAPAAVPAVAAAPAPAPVVAMDLPPVSPQTQQIAQQRIEAARSVPEENIQLASGDYPLLNDVPRTAPATGDAAAAAQLEKVRLQLEVDRNAASATTRQVKDEAAAEPSMLSDLPPTSKKAPAPAAIESTPIAPPAPAAAPKAPALPPTGMMERAPVPPSRIAELPPPPAPMVAANAPIAMDALPMGEARIPVAATTPAAPPMAADGLPPIQLKAPLPAMASADTSFNPMQGAAPITLTPPQSRTATGTFLPTSRYAYRR